MDFANTDNTSDSNCHVFLFLSSKFQGNFKTVLLLSSRYCRPKGNFNNAIEKVNK